jgi:hypothetical protein
MKLTYIFILALLAACSLTACERDEPEVKYTATYPVSGEWWVTYKVETSPGVFEDIYEVGYTELLTFNTASNTADSIWVSDEGHFWDFKVKSGLNMSNYSFAVADQKSVVPDYDIKVNITEGKVLQGVGLSRSGVKTDSIYFKVQFEDDPDNTYIVSGHRRTGFLEDDF